ncbi:hypothetical protein BD310DRAFT_611117 [Dichomitus squalens]|uniref:F-box domain-containing protein n=1 Tax=Dichomitus squalens TaxID=114155 RepID=A0A4Q9PQD5_9APHY|nr:hypothetical protein BD310DRAFT_611117 [Dichomitus squalens]
MKNQQFDMFPFPDFASVPETDRASLAGLSSDEIRAWTLRKSEEYRLLSYTMLSLHNAAAPIHTLPPELLVKIFGQTWKDWRSVHLTSVCRRWRSVYLSTPQFWAAAVSGLTFFYYDGTVMAGREDVRPVTAALLERSCPCLIKAKIMGPDELHPLSSLPVELSVHSYRISSLQLYVDGRLLHDLPRLLEKSTPALETLDIYGGDEDAQLGRFDLTSLPRFSELNLPHLHEVFISPAEFFPLFTARSLRRVKLSESHYDPDVMSPDPRVLLRALRNCPNIETLQFSDYAIPYEWPVPGDVAVVHLPLLKELGIFDTSDTSVCAMLNAISVPLTALIYAAGEDIQSLADLIPCHLFRSRPFDRVALCIHDECSCEMKCFADDSHQVWKLQLDGHCSLGDVLLRDYFQGMHVTHLEVLDETFHSYGTSWRDSTCTVEDWAVPLQAFPHLTSFTVCGGTGPSFVLPALAQCTTTADAPSTQLPCPALQNLVLCWAIENTHEPTNLPEGCDTVTYASRDAEEHIRWRCSTLQPVFEQRALKGAPSLKTLIFWEYETMRHRPWLDDAMKDGRVRIPSTCRDDSSSACLARLRGVVGGPVVYGGYLLGKTSDDW